MPDAYSTARRLIQRDQLVRDGGNEPSPRSVGKIVDLVAENQLYRDDAIRAWLVARASINDYLIATRLLQLAAPMSVTDSRMMRLRFSTRSFRC